MPLVVRNLTRDTLLASRAERAASFYSRFVGLMGRAALPFGEGLWIDPCNAIHTFFMRIPIDAVFLDPEQRVITTLSALVPWRATRIYRKARTVLELPAGTLTASRTAEGDQLEFRSSSAFDPPPRLS